MGRTERTASTWSKAIAPAPSMASVEAPPEASRLVASPHTAPVRIAVRVGPSTRPTGLPSASKTTTSPVGLPGTVDTTLTAMMSSRRPGITSELATWVRSGDSDSPEKACSMASMASGMGSAARVSAGLR